MIVWLHAHKIIDLSIMSSSILVAIAAILLLLRALHEEVMP